MINDRIRFPQVRVVDEANNQLGVLDTRVALDIARDRDLDLILVAAQAQPPVCRIMDYGKYKYEKSKKDKKVKNTANELKTVRLHPRTSEHDRSIVSRHSERFLREGHKVRVVCQFKGRENAYPDIGRKQLDAVAQELTEIANVEGQVIKQGREMAMLLSPKAGLKPLPKAGAEDKAAKQDEAEFERIQQQVSAEVEAEEADVSMEGADAPDIEASSTEDSDEAVEAESASDDSEEESAEPIAHSLEEGENDVEPQAQPT
jgi:translation initiation factor IF-3